MVNRAVRDVRTAVGPAAVATDLSAERAAVQFREIEAARVVRRDTMVLTDCPALTVYPTATADRAARDGIPLPAVRRESPATLPTVVTDRTGVSVRTEAAGATSEVSRLATTLPPTVLTVPTDKTPRAAEAAEAAAVERMVATVTAVPAVAEVEAGRTAHRGLEAPAPAVLSECGCIPARALQFRLAASSPPREDKAAMGDKVFPEAPAEPAVRRACMVVLVSRMTAAVAAGAVTAVAADEAATAEAVAEDLPSVFSTQALRLIPTITLITQALPVRVDRVMGTPARTVWLLRSLHRSSLVGRGIINDVDKFGFTAGVRNLFSARAGSRQLVEFPKQDLQPGGHFGVQFPAPDMFGEQADPCGIAPAFLRGVCQYFKGVKDQ